MNKRSRNGTGWWTNTKSKSPKHPPSESLFATCELKPFWFGSFYWWKGFQARFIMEGVQARFIMEGVSSKTARTGNSAKRRFSRCTQWSCPLEMQRWNFLTGWFEILDPWDVHNDPAGRKCKRETLSTGSQGSIPCCCRCSSSRYFASLTRMETEALTLRWCLQNSKIQVLLGIYAGDRHDSIWIPWRKASMGVQNVRQGWLRSETLCNVQSPFVLNK